MMTCTEQIVDILDRGHRLEIQPAYSDGYTLAVVDGEYSTLARTAETAVNTVYRKTLEAEREARHA